MLTIDKLNHWSQHANLLLPLSREVTVLPPGYYLATPNPKP